MSNPTASELMAEINNNLTNIIANLTRITNDLAACKDSPTQSYMMMGESGMHSLPPEKSAPEVVENRMKSEPVSQSVAFGRTRHANQG